MLIFDLDGTLIDSRRDLTTGVNLMRKYYSLPPLDVDTVTSYVGNGARKLVERAIPSDSSIDIDEAIGLFKKHYTANMVNETSCYPAVEETLEKLARDGWKMAIITNKPGAMAEDVLKELGIARYFTHIIGGDSKLPLKPDPASLLYVIEQNNAAIADTWMIGDNYTDLAAGRNAGVRRCYASYGFGHLNGEEFDAEIKSFDELVNIVKN